MVKVFFGVMCLVFAMIINSFTFLRSFFSRISCCFRLSTEGKIGEKRKLRNGKGKLSGGKKLFARVFLFFPPR
jgi:hypothetical protein